MNVENVEVTEDDSVTAWTHWDTALAQLDLRIAGMPTGAGLKHSAATQADCALEVIRKHHARVANAIRDFWGHKECCAYIENLLLSGTTPDKQNRCGFSQEVVACLLLLMGIHDKIFGSYQETNTSDMPLWF